MLEGVYSRGNYDDEMLKIAFIIRATVIIIKGS